MAIVFKNNAKTTLAGNVTTSATSITVSDGSVFPAISGGDTFFCTFDDGTNNEIVSVTAISGNVLTVVRAQDNTTAKAFGSGDAAESRLTAGILSLFSQTGVAITDDIEAYLDANGTTFPDNVKAQFGTGNDLQIFHDNSNSYIRDLGTGNLRIDATDFYVRNSAGTQLKIGAVDNGAVNLYYGSSGKKLATTSSGIDVTGVITTDGLTTSADINFGDNDKAVFGASSDLQIYHDGSTSYILDDGFGDLQLRSNNRIVIAKSPFEYMADFNVDGAVDLYYDNSKKLATTSTGINVTGTATMDGLTVDGTATISASSATLNINGSNTGASLINFGDSDDGNVGRIYYDHAGNFMQFKAADGERLRINSTGIDVTGTVTSDIFKGATFGTNSFLDFDDDNGVGGTQNTTTLASIGNMNFILDSNNNESNLFYWLHGNTSPYSATQLMTLNESGNLSVTGTVTATGGNSTNWNTAYGWGNHASQSYATQSYVGTQISNLVDSSPAALNTLNELAAALGDDANFSTTVNANIAAKLPLAGGTMTGTLAMGANAITSTGTISSGAITANGTADGSIINITKNTAGVGNIGVDNSDNLVIEGNSTHSGLQFASNVILPHKNGAIIDATIGLGNASSRFSDLYLSGSITSGAITATTTSGSALNVNSGTTNVVAKFESGDATAWISLNDSASGTYGALLGAEGGLFRLRTNSNDANTDLTVDTAGNLGVSGDVVIGTDDVGVNDDANITVKEGNAFAGIDLKSLRTSGNIGGVRSYNSSNTLMNNLLFEVQGRVNLNNNLGIAINGTTFIDGARNFNAANGFVASNTWTSNDQPSSSNAIYSGYGSIGNRSVFYITNGGGSVQIGNGATHNTNPTATFSTAVVNLGANRILQMNGQTVLDASRNLTNIGTINSGAITSSGNINLTSTTATSPAITFNASSGTDTTVDMAIRAVGEGLDFYEPEDGEKLHMRIIDDDGVNATYGFRTGAGNGTLRINADGNLTNIGTISSGAINVNSAGAGSVAAFRGDNYNQVNIAHTSNTSWGMLLTNSNSTSNSGYHNSTSGANNSIAIVNVNNDALHFGTNNGLKFTIDHLGNLKHGTAQTTILDTSRNLINIGTISSGAISATSITATGSTTSENALRTTNGRLQLGPHTSGSGIWFDESSTAQSWFVGLSGSSFRLYKGGNKLTITSAGNATFAGTINSGAITSTGTSSFTNVNTRSDTFNKIYSVTDQANAGIEFSSQNPSPDQKGNIFFQHGNSLSYGTGAAFTINSTETLTILADGRLMFKDGLYVKPASGTGSGTQIIDSSKNLLNIGTISSGVHTITSSGTIGGATVANGYLKITDGTDTMAFDVNEIHTTDNLYLLAEAGNIIFRDTGNGGVALKNGGTQFMDASRNLTSIGTISQTGAVSLNSNSLGDPDSTSRTNYPAGQMLTHYSEANGVSIIGGQGNYTGCGLTIGEETGHATNFKFIRGIADTNGTPSERFSINGVGDITTMGNISAGFTHLYKAGTNNVQTIVAVVGSDSTRPVLQFSESAATAINAGMSLEYNGQGSGASNYMSINSVTGASMFQFSSGGDFRIGSNTVISSGRAVTAVSYGAPSGTTALYNGYNGAPMVQGVNGAAYYHGSDNGGYGIVIQGGHPICKSVKIGSVNAGTTVITAAKAIESITSISMSGNLYMNKSQPWVIISNTTEDGGGVVFTDNQADSAGTGGPGSSSQAFRMTYHCGNETLIMGHDDNSYTGFTFGKGGALTCSGNVTAYSDERLKDNIETLDGKKALQMRGVSFTKDGEEGSGVIAQELEKIAPELVTTDKVDGIKSVAYGNLVGYLIEAIKDQQKEIEYMKSEIKHLQENNNGDN